MQKGDHVLLRPKSGPAAGWIPPDTIGTVLHVRQIEEANDLHVDVDFGMHGVLWAQPSSIFDMTHPQPAALVHRLAEKLRLWKRLQNWVASLKDGRKSRQ